MRACVCVCVYWEGGGQCFMTNVYMLILCVLMSVFCLFGWLVGVCLFVCFQLEYEIYMLKA